MEFELSESFFFPFPFSFLINKIIMSEHESINMDAERVRKTTSNVY